MSHHAVNRVVALIMPFILFGCSCFLTWAIIDRIAIGLLLGASSPLLTPHSDQAIACLFFYVTFFLLMWLPYFRMMYTLSQGYGLIPVGQEGLTKFTEKTELAKFFQKDRFLVVHPTFLTPKWCEKCNIWKPDRTHHCGEMDRCVRRMDHFCPWVGGVISEANHKYFIQFLFWAFFYCNWAMAWFVYGAVESQRKLGSIDNVIKAVLGVGGFFTLFVSSLFFQSGYWMLINKTTVENLVGKSAKYHIAISSSAEKRAKNIPDMPEDVNFYVHTTEMGENPWDLGWRENFCQIMGRNPVHWFLPIGISPCITERGETEFRFGPVVPAS